MDDFFNIAATKLINDFNSATPAALCAEITETNSHVIKRSKKKLKQ